MKGRIIHIDREDSISQANDALRTLSSCGWDVELQEGFNRDSVKEYVAQNGYKVMSGSRLHDFMLESEPKFWTKVACLMNNVETWIEAVTTGEPQAFFEHDAIGVNEPLWNRLAQVEDFCFLSMAYAWKSPTTLAGKCHRSLAAWEMNVTCLSRIHYSIISQSTVLCVTATAMHTKGHYYPLEQQHI